MKVWPGASFLRGALAMADDRRLSAVRVFIEAARGRGVQDYVFLVYSFGGPQAMTAYLQERFDRIDQPGSHGQNMAWAA